jgi:hypothetical protein
MSGLEDRLQEALQREGGRTTASPDLFQRVADSIDADRLRRSRRARGTALGMLVLGCLAALIALTTPRDEEGLHMSWWVLELGTNAVLVVVAVWLGPFIKRFGRAYAADVFHDNPMTGKSYIVLTDIVYYLIFAAYILFTLRLEAMPGSLGEVTAEQVESSCVRAGGILLIIGVLHGLNIVLMPVLGRLFSLNRRLPRDY